MGSRDGCRYVVITPAKDEAAYIGETLLSVSRQTLRPDKWVLVDDRSKDETAAIVRQFMKQNDWIELVSLDSASQRFPGTPVVNAFSHGLRRLQDSDYDFIVKLDADLRLPEDYFEKLMANFERDPELGIASGVYLEKTGERWDVVTMPSYHAAGACKFMRKGCFADIGGFVPSLGWDTIDEIRARSKGWRTRHFTELPFYHLKNEGSGIGKLRTSMVHGRIFYLTGGKAGFFVLKAAKRMIVARPPLLHGVLMVWGYLEAAVKREKRLVTPEEAALYNRLLAERVASGAKFFLR